MGQGNSTQKNNNSTQKNNQKNNQNTSTPINQRTINGIVSFIPNNLTKKSLVSKTTYYVNNVNNVNKINNLFKKYSIDENRKSNNIIRFEKLEMEINNKKYYGIYAISEKNSKEHVEVISAGSEN